MSDALPDLDDDVLAALRELMQDDYPLLVDTFTRDAELRLRQLQSHLQDSDWRALRYSAHSFKGSCGNMGALALQELCLQVEVAADSADEATVRALLSQMHTDFQRVADRLRCA
ncbi:Hpt domain-containing protein [Halopseudomonas salegens]|uniref:Hpt domain-containing protein n=1 Tax=Halopseudomonas salegens TaxID=1434072 RepID=A0A1H2G3P1_9GAMM|nr:Hpt domain-containing protein [Halopseudomonas salegens]SDU14167.1 Hpt domain-containing protein [Halopseudomonas salegens]